MTNICIVCSDYHNNKTFCSRACQLKEQGKFLELSNEQRRNGELPSGQLGKKHSEKTKLKMSMSHIGCVFSEDRKMNIRKSLTGKKLSDGHRKNLSIARRKVWANFDKYPNLRNIFMANSFNKFERILLKVLKEVSGQWVFVGDGKLIISGKCPDFWDSNNKLIELYGEYWHKTDNSQERIEYFRKFGYETLIIWGKELRDEMSLKKKISSFSSSELSITEV